MLFRSVLLEVRGCKVAMLIPEHVESACSLQSRGRAWHPPITRLAWSPLLLDVLCVLMIGCSAAAFVATAVTISLLAAVGKTRRHEFCTVVVIICSRLPLVAAIAAAVTPVALVTVLRGCATALVAYRIFSVCPLISNLHGLGDGLWFCSSECFLQLESIDASGERVYRVVF